MELHTAEQIADDGDKISAIRDLVSESISEDRGELVERLKKFALENELSCQDLADQLPGYAKSTVAMYMAGTYHARLSGIDEAVRSLLERQIVATDRGRQEKLPYTQTSITEIVTRVCKMTQKYQDLGALCSYIAGVGKTIACKNYAAGRANVYYVYLGEVYRGIKAIFAQIYRELTGSEPPRGHITVIFEEIIKHVQGKNALIILDECDSLTVHPLNAIRQIRDRTDVGILFVGNIGLHTNLTKFRGTFLAQLYSRIKVFQYLTVEITEDDVRALIAHYHPEPSDAMVKFLLDYATVRGFRMMENMMDWGMEYAKGDGRERFNIKDLQKASNHLML